MAATANAAEQRDALVERLFMDAISAFDLLSVYLGDVLGLYRTLADKGPLTSAELAEAAGIHERYAREWLEQQAASSLLELEPSGDTRRYRLPEGHDEALLDSSSLSYRLRWQEPHPSNRDHRSGPSAARRAHLPAGLDLGRHRRTPRKTAEGP